jgi:hypothetical protein
MTELTVPEEAAQLTSKDRPKPIKTPQVSLQNTVTALKSLKDDAGQIVELTAEEKTLVAEFFHQFMKLTVPLAQSIPVSPSALLTIKGEIVQANIAPTGHLIIIYPDGTAELEDLSAEKNRNLMLSVVEDALPKFTQLMKNHKQKIEGRINFLSSVTKEMQDISEALNTTPEA